MDDTRRWQTIPRVTEVAAERFGDTVAVVDGDNHLTFAELDEEARTFGAALMASGIEPGDRVSIWAFNSLEWIVAAQACGKRKPYWSRSTRRSRESKLVTSCVAAVPESDIPTIRLFASRKTSPQSLGPSAATRMLYLIHFRRFCGQVHATRMAPSLVVWLENQAGQSL